MKQLQPTVRNSLIITFMMSLSLVWGQDSKTYKETFKVDSDVEVALNTSYADIEFETWNRNEVSVEAVITLEGASEEEAEAYFATQAVEIMGNSSRVEVSTRTDNRWSYKFSGMDDFDFEMPDVEIPDISRLLENLEIPEIPELAAIPPMPPMPPIPSFDYEAYEEDGEAYMKKWQEKFQRSFDSKYKERFQEWSKQAEERASEMKARMKEREAERQARMEERERINEERNRHLEEAVRQREMARAQLAEAREQIRKDREKARVFFMRGEGGDRNYSIKKKIRIRMPKGARLKLDVRHGEVKLAENAVDIKATLSYASLLASTIEGEGTWVNARYSPITVKAWRSGKLQADYSEQVQLDEVSRLILSATSSDVTIDRILREASIRNDLGALRIGSIAGDFEDMSISIKNGKLNCGLPKEAFLIKVYNRNSEVAYPAYVVWDPSGSAEGSTKSGYHQNKDATRSIVINASYSDIDLR